MKKPSTIALALAAAAFSIPAFAADDAGFLTDAIKADNTEVAIGGLAERQGASPQVREYGAMLVRDHGAHRMKIAELDHAMGVTPTSAIADDGARTEAMLRDLHGAQFDAAFKQAMIHDHMQAIAMYEDEGHATQSDRIRMLVRDTLPTLHMHLDHAKAL